MPELPDLATLLESKRQEELAGQGSMVELSAAEEYNIPSQEDIRERAEI